MPVGDRSEDCRSWRRLSSGHQELALAKAGDNQKTAHAEIELYFDTGPAAEMDVLTQTEKNHGRIETRRHLVSQHVDWMSGKQRYPDEPRFQGLKTIAMIETCIEVGGTIKTERRCYISSRVLTAKAFAEAARAHWAIENGLHWVLDVEFKEDQSRLRRGHGAKNMARVRHLALNLIRAMPGKTSIKGKRKLATWDTAYLLTALSLSPR